MGRNLLGKTGFDVLVSDHGSDLLLHFELLSKGLDKGLSGNVLNCDAV